MINKLEDTLAIMSTVWANSGGGFAFLSEKILNGQIIKFIGPIIKR